MINLKINHLHQFEDMTQLDEVSYSQLQVQTPWLKDMTQLDEVNYNLNLKTPSHGATWTFPP